MNPDDDTLPPDSDPADALNAYLDDLARGRESPNPALDPSLAAAVRRVHDLADATTVAHASAADEQRTWEALMGYPSTAPVVPFPSLPAAPPASPEPRQARSYPRRLGRAASRPLGLVATLTLVVLVGLSAFAAYRISPRGSDPDPTSIPAFAGDGTVTAETAPSNEADPVWGTLDDGTEYVRIPWGDCDVAPADFEDVMETVVGEDYPLDYAPPTPQIASTEAGPNGTRLYTFTDLPTGEPVSDDIIAAVVDTYATYLGCQDVPLRQAPLFTAEGLVREYWEVPSIYLQDGGADGHRLAMLWADHMGRQGVDEEHIGKLSPIYLYDFRMRADGSVVAYMSGGHLDELPQFYVEAGYVVFRQQDGQWLIDEQFRR